ncbi:PEPxxWA-CTERM sorting domain-containing protein [Thermaurantiacus sp.]
MRKLVAIAAALAATPAFATYLPVGPQKDVPLATVLGGGWTLCYSATMAAPFGTSAADTLTGCGAGSRIMLAGRRTGADTLLVLAQTTKADAFADTGADDNGIYTTSNGADWFYAADWSWGFKPVGAPFMKLTCSFFALDSSMCIHTSEFVGGFSINTLADLSHSTEYEKLVFVFGGGVIPEPGSWVMLIAGFGLVGRAARRSAAAIA